MKKKMTKTLSDNYIYGLDQLRHFIERIEEMIFKEAVHVQEIKEQELHLQNRHIEYH